MFANLGVCIFCAAACHCIYSRSIAVAIIKRVAVSSSIGYEPGRRDDIDHTAAMEQSSSFTS